MDIQEGRQFDMLGSVSDGFLFLHISAKDD